MIRISISKKLNLTAGATELVVDAQLPLQGITALYGKSGAGKTSLLKILAGLMQPEEGFIEVNGQVWLNTAKKINLPPQKRNIGFVFQDYALFPNMTVRQNLLYAADNKTDHNQIDHLLTITQLNAFAHHKPYTLSGGQKQRAALARALVRRPSLLLLDEPLSALDPESRLQLQQKLLQLHQEYNFTALLVSHDIDEILSLAGHVLNINNGRIIKSGKPVDLFATTSPDNKLHLTGLVVNITGDWADVLVHQQVIKVKQAGLKVGDRIDLLFDHS